MSDVPKFVARELAAVFGADRRRGERDAWQVCPTCGGRGAVPHNFYGDQPGTIGFLEECRTCGGDTVLSRLNGCPPSRQPDNPGTPASETDPASTTEGS